jgi:probable HAF family extracellular repeat protein
MKSILTLIASASLLATFAPAQTPHATYTVTDLGTAPGGTFSQATFVNNNGFVAGIAAIAGGAQHGYLWYEGLKGDIGIPGLGGPNSGAFGVNESGLAMGQAETSTKDPNNENFCAYGTGLQCLAFLWQNGVTTALPTLGGTNASVGHINNVGELAGYAENSVRDATCPAGMAVTGTGPQVLDFEPVIWGPQPGQIRQLGLLAGDTVGIAMWNNDLGQAVGVSGTCANTVIPPVVNGPHAVLWEPDGSVSDLGNLGGTVNPAIPGIGQAAVGINNQGQVVGASALAGNSTAHAFLWSRLTGMRDLGTLAGDVHSAGLGISDRGEVVGISLDGMGNPRPFLWKDGVMTDLNSLVDANSPLHLLFASGINSRGQIEGFGVTDSGDVHGYLASPSYQSSTVLTTTNATNAVVTPLSVTTSQASVVLDASGSTSASGNLQYLFSVAPGGLQAALLQTPNNPKATVDFVGGAGLYLVQLTVTDASGGSAKSPVIMLNYQP